jgi:peptide/nickel transport system substrate-binding protein
MSTQQKKSRTRTYVAAAILIVIILAGAGYYLTQKPTPTGVTTTTPTGVTATSAAYKDTLIIGTTDSVATTIDPANAYDLFGGTVIVNLGSALVDFQPGTSNFVPALATDWTVSSDGLTWTFNLRQGVKFSDGTPFNATSVKYTFDRGIGINDPNGPFVGVGYGSIINRTEVTGPYQVVFHLNVPFAPFLSLMGNEFNAPYIVNPKYAPPPPAGQPWSISQEVNYTAGDARRSNPMDLGPYVLTEWIRVGGKDTEMKLDANPNYWNASGGNPKTPHIIIKFYSDQTTLGLAITNGEIDIAFRQLNPTDLINMQSNPAVKVWKGAGSFIQYLVMNEKIKPFDDVHVRQGLAAAINRTAITTTVFRGQATPLYSIVPIGMFSHTDVFKVYGDANYTYAQQVLAQAGFTPSHKLVVDLWYPTGHYGSAADIATVVKSSWEASGVIQVNLHTADWATYSGQNVQVAENMPVFIYGWYPDYSDPNDYTYNFFHSAGSTWLHDHYANPKADAVINQALASGDMNTRLQLYVQAQHILAQDVPLIPMFQGSSFAVSKPNVGGIVVDFPQILRYWLLYETTTST